MGAADGSAEREGDPLGCWLALAISWGENLRSTFGVALYCASWAAARTWGVMQMVMMGEGIERGGARKKVRANGAV